MKQAVRLMMTAWSGVANQSRHWPTVVVTALFTSLLGGLIPGEAQRAIAQDIPLRSFEARLKPVGKVEHPGLVVLNMEARVPSWNKDCRNVKAKLTAVDGLQIRGETEWDLTLSDTTVYRRRIEVIIPPDDTSGITLDFMCPNSTVLMAGNVVFFLPEGDSVKLFWGDPRGFDVPHAEIPVSERPPQGRRVKGEFPHWDSLYPILDDSVKLPTITYHREDRSASEHATQDSLERSPLTEQRVQIISVDGQTLVRRRGETRFHPIESKTEGEWNVYWKKRYDSTVAANWNVTYDVWIDLHSPDDLNFAKGLIDSLMPTDTAGIYRAAINKGTINRLSERKISIRKWGANPNERKPVPTRHEKDKLNMAPK